MLAAFGKVFSGPAAAGGGGGAAGAGAAADAAAAGGGGAAADVGRNIKISDTVIDAYAAILGVEPEIAKDIIDNSVGAKRANTNTSDYFSTKHAALTSITAASYGDPTRAIIEGKEASKLASGAYGSAWQIPGEGVYKIVDLTPDSNRSVQDWKFREIFIEALVQTILQNDTLHGKNIATITNLYRLELRGYTGFVIKMEYVANTFKTYLQSVAGRGVVNLATIGPFFTDLGQILSHFERKYGFQHRDLHPGNVMVADDDTIKLIDFGLSCLDIGGQIYSLNMNPRCESYDPLVFLAALRDGGEYYPLLDEDVRARIREYFTGDDGIDYYREILNWMDTFYMKAGGRYLIDPYGDKALKKKGQAPPQAYPQHYFYFKYSIESEDPRPWKTVFRGGKTLFDEFTAAGMPRRATYEYFSRAWNPAGLVGGARRRKSRRRRRGSKATRRRN
jgi:serine/threonine protein kinase